MKASSAQEAVDRKEKLEKELKSKNLEMADLIRERDKARHELDRLQGVRKSWFTLLTQSQKDHLDHAEREARVHKTELENVQKSKGSEMSSLIARYTREINDFQDTLRVRR